MYKEILAYCKDRKVDLIVVSKLRSLQEVKAIYDVGHRKFAENRVQDLLQKQTNLPPDIQWHLIGTLQTNKVKYVAPFIQLIHSIDDLALWHEVHRHATKVSRVIPCLLQLKVARENTKNGFEWNELLSVLDQGIWKSYVNAPIHGIMGMATFTDDKVQVRREFKKLKQVFDTIKSAYFIDNQLFTHISMGMSDDYKMAIEEGSTMVRIGSLLFGKRG